jgi:hypothetical protein
MEHLHRTESECLHDRIVIPVNCSLLNIRPLQYRTSSASGRRINQMETHPDPSLEGLVAPQIGIRAFTTTGLGNLLVASLLFRAVREMEAGLCPRMNNSESRGSRRVQTLVLLAEATTASARDLRISE